MNMILYKAKDYVHRFVKKHRSRTIELWLLSAPIIFEQIFITLMGMVSTMMSANISEQAVSAIGMVDSLSNIFIAFFAALTTGGTIVIAQYVGRRDMEKVKDAAVQTLIVSLFFSVLITILTLIFKRQVIFALYGNAEEIIIEHADQFLSVICFSFPILAVFQGIFGILRGTGNTRTPMNITIIMNICNVVISFPLIFGVNIGFIHFQGFGVLGVAIGLLLARTVGFILAVYYIIYKSNNVRLNKFSHIKLSMKIQKIILSLGIPTSVESVLFNVGRLVTQIYVVGMGTQAMMANSVAGSIFGFINVPGVAFSTAVMILVGHRVGRREFDDIKSTNDFAIKFGFVLMTIVCLIFFVFTNLIIKAYNCSPEAAVFLKQIMYTGFIATPLFWPAAFITPSALRATGDVKFTMIISLATMWIFRISAGYILGVVLGFGVVGVWCGMYIDWFMRGVFFRIRLRKEKWRSADVGL